MAQAEQLRPVVDRLDRADDVGVARGLARAAGDLLLGVRADAEPSAGRRLGALGDRLADDLILGALARLRPGDAVLSEESVDDPTRLSAERVWIVDPLDGTREYAEGRGDFAVHVALWQRGVLVAGAVALPGLDRVVDSGGPPSVPGRDPAAPVRIAVSRTRPPAFLAEVAALLGAQAVPLGSAGYKACAVLTGEVDAYVHAGGQYEWDSAAPVCVAAAAGLHTSRVDGAPLEYNRADPSLPDLVVSRPELAGALLAALTGRESPVEEVRA